MKIAPLIPSTRRTRKIIVLVAALPASLAAQQTQAGALQGSVSDAVRGHPVAAAILDGTEVPAMDGTTASQIAAVEIYVDGAFVPSRYAIRDACGVVVFWTKSMRRIAPPKPAAAPESPRP